MRRRARSWTGRPTSPSAARQRNSATTCGPRSANGARWSARPTSSLNERSGGGRHLEEPGRVAAEDHLPILLRYLAELLDRLDRLVVPHVEDVVGPEHDAVRSHLADEVRQDGVVVPDGVVVEAPQVRRGQL